MKRDLKLEDLKERSEIVPMKLLSVRVPVDLIQRIDDVVDLLNAGKGEVVVALLNEGLGRYDKAKGGVRFVGIATGMNSLIRPALYGAYHEIANLTRLDEPANELVSVVGPICESADVLGHDRLLPPTREGDVLHIANAGAYGRTMSSEYNLRPPAEELFL